MLLAALSFVAWQGVFAESPLKPEGVATNSWPSEIALIQPVEFPTATGSGQTGTVMVPQGAVMKLIGVHGDSVDVAYRNLTARLPAAATDLGARMETQKWAAASEPRAVPPIETAEEKPQAGRYLSGAKTFIEASMNAETFKASGLDKLSRAELEALDRWFLTMSSVLLTTSRPGAASQQGKETVTVPSKQYGPLERVLLLKDFNGDRILIQRADGEKWLLRAKTWCRWSWRYEGRYVSLLFGPTSSQLINDAGETFNFWIDKKID